MVNACVLQVPSDTTINVDNAQQTPRLIKIQILVYVKMVSPLMHRIITVFQDVGCHKYGKMVNVSALVDTAGLVTDVDNVHKVLDLLLIKEHVYVQVLLLSIFLILISV